MENTYSHIAHTLKEKIAQKGISLRQLSKEVEIDAATLSRFINQKQKPNMMHLEKLSEALDVPLNELLIDMGYKLDSPSKPSECGLSELDVLDEVKDEQIFRLCRLLEDDKTISSIEKKLSEYSKYIQLPEGKEMVIDSFESKIHKIGQAGPVIDLLKQFYQKFLQLDLALPTAILIGSGLIYFILATDVVPDFFFPLGFIDDAIAIQMIQKCLEKSEIKK